MQKSGLYNKTGSAVGQEVIKIINENPEIEKSQ